MDWASRLSSATERDLTRRQMLSLLGGGAAIVGSGKAVDNVFIGYGVLVGTNLRDEDLAKLARARLKPSPFDTTISGTRIRFDRRRRSCQRR